MLARPWIAILVGGLIAGTGDILYAIIYSGFYGRSPLTVLQSVASGWLGKPAFSGGVPAGALGLASHYAISIVWAAIYFAASQRLAFAKRHWIASGALFGMAVYLFMSYVVVPLSAAPFRMPATPEAILRGFVSHALLFGLPIAWCRNKWGQSQHN
jgi:uncharacterized membrane protein (DUF485 family)